MKSGFFLAVTLFFTSVHPLWAAVTEPDYPYSAAIIYKNAADDPSLACTDGLDEGCKTFFDRASVTCTDDQDYITRILEDPNQKFTTGPGLMGGTITHLPNLAPDTETFIEDYAGYLKGLMLGSSYPGDNNIAILDAACLALSKGQSFDRDECYCEELGIGTRREDGSCDLNEMNAAKGIPRTLTREQQYNLVKKRADHLKTNLCQNNNQGNCEPDHPCFGEGTVLKSTLANQVPDTYEEYASLDSFAREQIKSCVGSPSNTTKPLFLVVVPEWNKVTAKSIFNTTICGILDDFINLKVCHQYVPSYSLIAAPGLGAAEMSSLENQLTNTKNKWKETKDEIEAASNQPLNWSQISGSGNDAIIDAILQKAIANKNTCATKNTTMFMGSVFNTGDNSAKARFNFSILDFLKANGQSPFSFRMYLIAPEELAKLDILNATGKNSIGNSLLTLLKRFKQVDIPSGLVSAAESTTITKTIIDYDHPYDCYDPQTKQNKTCYPEIIVPVASGNAPEDTANLRGGGVVSRANLAKRILLSRNNTSHQSTTCYFNNEAQSNPKMINLALGQIEKFNDPRCNEYLNIYTSSEVNVCNATSHPPMLDASGACKICNSENFEFASNLPESLIKIFESAGQEFNVPGSVVMGIFFGEGGFQRITYNGKECYGPWTDESVQAASSCGGEIQNCQTCNVSGVGALGPLQQRPKYIDPATNGNPCNLYEAARNTAYQIHRGRVGYPTWEDTCAGINLHNNDGAHYSRSCTDWTLEDVATAARAHRGLCDPEFQNRVIDLWKQYTCGTGVNL
jgi:hypothetical protein